MKARTLISVAVCGLMGAVAVDLMVILHRHSLGQDLFDIGGLIIPTLVGGALGALLRRYFSKTEEEPEEPTAVREQVLPETALPGVAGDQPLPLREEAKEVTQEVPKPEEVAEETCHAEAVEAGEPDHADAAAAETAQESFEPEVVSSEVGQELFQLEVAVEEISDSEGTAQPLMASDDIVPVVSEGEGLRQQVTEPPVVALPAQEPVTMNEEPAAKQHERAQIDEGHQIWIQTPQLDSQEGPSSEEAPSDAVAKPKEDERERPSEEQGVAVQDSSARLEKHVAEPMGVELPQRREKEFPAHFIESAAAFFVALDAQGRVEMMSRSMAETLGYTADEVLGKDFLSSFISQEMNSDLWDALLQPTAKAHEQLTIESCLVTKEGREILVEWHGTKASESVDGSLHCFLVGIDLSARKQAEEAMREEGRNFKALHEQATRQLEHYRSALNSSPDAVVIYDREGKATYANPAFSAKFGWTVEDLQDEQTLFVEESQRALERPIIDTLIEKRLPCRKLHVQRISKDGSPVTANMTLSLFLDEKGEPAGTFVVLRDVFQLSRVGKPPAEVEKPLPKPLSQRPKRQVSAKEMVNDIRSGFTDAQLMEKHDLTAKGLHKVYQKMIEAKVLKPAEIYGRLDSGDETVVVELSPTKPAQPRQPRTEPPKAQPKTVKPPMEPFEPVAEPSKPVTEAHGPGIEPRRPTAAPTKSAGARTDESAGTSGSRSMKQFGLTAGGLDDVFANLVAAGVISPQEIRKTTSPTAEPDQEAAQRTLPRHYMVVSVPVYEADNLLVEGTILDINEKGLRINGIRTFKGETKSLLVQGDGFHDVYPFVFDAVCRWAKIDESTGETEAGFQITEISEASLEELGKLIAALSISS